MGHVNTFRATQLGAGAAAAAGAAGAAGGAWQSSPLGPLEVQLEIRHFRYISALDSSFNHSFPKAILGLWQGLFVGGLGSP